MKIIYESNDFLVVDKESGYLSIPGRLNRLDPRPCLLTELEKKFNQKIFVVHRLDCEVSGLILYAKNSESHRYLNSLFENHKVKKTYEALTELAPNMSCKKFYFNDKLVKGKKRAFIAPYGKIAQTDAELISINSKIGFWRLMPKTGRFHQLRFQLYNYGCPILNDSLYNSTILSNDSKKGIALRSVQIEFDDFKFKSDIGIQEYYKT